MKTKEKTFYKINNLFLVLILTFVKVVSRQINTICDSSNTTNITKTIQEIHSTRKISGNFINKQYSVWNAEKIV